jgi:outer membrane protein
MNKKITFLSFFILFVNIANAQNYNLNLLLDNQSSKYLQSIKSETKSLFSSNDKIKYNVNICEKSCEKFIGSNNITILKQSQKLNKKKNTHILTYNFISNSYDKNRVIRATALSIYEYLKENKKTKSVYLENKISKLLEIKEDKDLLTEGQLKLKDIFALALKNNFQIQQNQNSSRLDKLNIDKSKSSFKPKIDFYSNLIQIDKDRAKYSNGLYSEGNLEAGLTLTQVIYSDKIIQNIKIKKLLEKSNTNSIKAQNDVILYKVLITYLNVIKANKYHKIIKIKYNFIKQNLEFSKQRVEIGVDDRADIYRWESESANVNIELANSRKQLESLKIELANLLQIKKDFLFKEYSMSSNIFKLLNNDAIKYIANKKVQQLFLNDIIFSHTRLKQLKELINAKSEEYKMNKSSRYLPTVVFQGDISKTIERYGIDDPYNTRYWDDKEFEAVINLSLPLYEGGLKSIDIEKNEVELVNLKLQYNDVKSLIEKNVELNYNSLKKSYEKISFSKISQEYSKKNYQLIQDKYRNGKENIISLLDAQNSYIVSKLNENISIIDYLVDLSSIYFFSGNIEILVDENKKLALEENILNAIKSKGLLNE